MVRMLRTSLTIYLIASVFLFGLTRQAKARIAKAKPKNNFSKSQVRRSYVTQRAEQQKMAKRQAEEWAKKRGYPVRKDNGKRIVELMYLEDGVPVYYCTDNDDAAISTAANLVRSTSPYNANGAGHIAGIWDGGAVLSTHQEFGGRVTVQDGSSSHYHSTHVGGTIGAVGMVARAMGMAPAVNIDSYDWTSDQSEMADRAMSYASEPDTLQISNHSYGSVVGWDNDESPVRWYGLWGYRQSDDFGQYNSTARSWDEVCYNAPYYLPFKSAGNDRNDNAPSNGTTFEYYDSGWQTKSYNSSTDPCDDGWDNGGFDTIPTYGNAKNIMTVGSVNDAETSGGPRDITKATMSSFSGWGPTDDGRIKPDIVANGAGLYSCDNDNNSDYTTLSGTSMSSPNASGSAMLLIDYYSQLFPAQAMRASTIKALIIHTADDLGNTGPDYSFGWGLMNTKAAADIIGNNKIREDFLSSDDPNYIYEITLDANNSLRVTICWTDPQASSVSGVDNDSPRLINDLDLRVIDPCGTVYFPYILDPTNPADDATTGDNILDNIEQVYIQLATAGTYTIKVDHKGTLTNDEQYYSLISSVQFNTYPPAASDISTYTEPNSPVTITLQTSDDGWPDPPADVNSIITSLPSHGTLSDPCAADINSVPYALADHGSQVIYTPKSDCAATTDFTYKANDGGTAPNGGDSNEATVTIDIVTIDNISYGTGSSPWAYPMNTLCEDVRTQVIYLASEIGESGSLASLALNVSTTPGQILNNWTIRMKHTPLSSYSTPSLDATGWAVVYQTNEPQGTTGWRTFTFQTPFVYDNTNNLMIDFSFNNSDDSNVGQCRATNTHSTRSAYAVSDKSTDGDPLDWDGSTSPDVSGKTYVPNIKLSKIIPLHHDLAGDFEPDCDVDIFDLEVMVRNWLKNCGDCQGADLSGDNDVDFEDFAEFAENWLEGVE